MAGKCLQSFVRQDDTAHALAGAMLTGRFMRFVINALTAHE